MTEFLVGIPLRGFGVVRVDAENAEDAIARAMSLEANRATEFFVSWPDDGGTPPTPRIVTEEDVERIAAITDHTYSTSG